MQKQLFLASALLIAMTAFAQAAPHGSGTAWTVPDIFQNGGPIGEAPRNFLWSPGGARVTYLSKDEEHGQMHDVISVDAVDGSTSVLVPKSKLAAIFRVKNDEVDRDHRARYGQSSYHWSPDGKRLLFDNTGSLWLYNLGSENAVQVANTGAGSGDDPKFSPDTKFVSFIRDHNLHVIAVNGHHDTALTHATQATLLNGEVDWVYREELDVRSNYFWSPDSRHIVYLQMDETTVPTYPLTNWLSRHSTVYQQRYPQPGDPNPGARVGIVPVTGGNSVWLHVPIDHHNDYIPRFGWLDKRHVWIEVLRRDQKHLAIYFADIDTGAVRKVLEETDGKYLDTSYGIHFSHGGQFLFTSWRDGHRHIYLYSYNRENPLAEDASLVRQLTRGDWEVLGIAGMDEKRGVVYYTSNETDPREEMLWEINLNGTGKKVLSTLHGVHRIALAPDALHYVDTYSNVTTLPTVRVCDMSGLCRPFWQARPLHGYKLTAPIMFTGKASDGTVLYGELLLPPDMHRKASVPLIVNPYGGPEAQIVRDQFGEDGSVGQDGALFDQLLVQHGFAVLHADNRGTGNRGRAFADFAYRDFGVVQLRDQLTMVNQALTQYPRLDAKRLGWWGWSWGGTFTLYAMTHSDRFAAGVCVGPVTNWELYDSIYTERYLGLPTQNRQVYREDSVVNGAAHLHGNLLMVQGTADDNVHMQNTIQMIQKFVAADVPYRLLLFPGKTHSISGSAARIHLFSAILDQFETTLHLASVSKQSGSR